MWQMVFHRAREMKRVVAPGVSALLLCAALASATVRAQDKPLEHSLKAVYLFNFVKFVRWPPSAGSGPITICVAERNPFGEALDEAIRDETVDQRRLVARIISKPQPGCDVLFIPAGAGAKPYLQAARGSATLTVGEEPDFLEQGGMINFIIDGGSVRFEINSAAAERAQLRISAHLLRLARAGGRETAR